MNFYSIGFFGAPNFGDEVLCTTVVRLLQERQDAESIYVMSQRPAVSISYSGLDVDYVPGFWPRPAYFRHFRHHFRAVAGSRLVTVGGGGLFGDTYSWRSIVRYAIDPLLALALGRPYVLVGVGVAGIRRKLLRRLSYFVWCHAGAIYCRDLQSAEQIERETGRADIIVAPDLGYVGLRANLAGTDNRAPLDYVVLNLRADPPVSLATACDLIQEAHALGLRSLLLCAEPTDRGWYVALRSVAADRTPEARVEIVEPGTVQGVVDLLRASSLIVAERLHVGMAGALSGRPCLLIAYEDKVAELANALRVPCIAVDRFNAGKVSLALNESASLGAAPLLIEAARAAFHTAIDQGLASAPLSRAVRLRAALIVVALLCFGLLWCLWEAAHRMVHLLARRRA